MLKKLVIKNFQIHKKLKLEIDPGVTTVIGPSDIGKSAIIRALRWLAFNKPRGSAYINNETDSCSVILYADDHKITRAKGKSNHYKKNKTKLKAFGTKVPDEISQVLNLDELNFQGQHDAPFWFSISAGQVSKELNAIVDLEIIDMTMANLAALVRQSKTEFTICESRFQETKKSKKELLPVNKADADLAEVEKLEEEWYEILYQRRSLQKALYTVNGQRAFVEGRTIQLKAAKKALVLGEQWAQVHRTKRSLEFLIKAMRHEKETADQKLPNLKRLERLANKLKEKSKMIVKLKRMIRKGRKYKKSINKEKVLKARYKEEIEELIGDVCPLCNAPIKDCNEKKT